MMMFATRTAVLAVVSPLVLIAAAVADAQTAAPISYIIRIPAPHTHYVEVEATIPAEGRSEVELMMAVWTPGSYLVREYARNVEAVTARTLTGGALAVEKTRKNRWWVVTGGAAEVVVSYRLYCREMSVRTNWVEDGFAMLNGAPTFLTLADDTGRPHDVRLELPDGWSRSLTALPEAPGGRPHSYRAADFDMLVDSPIVAGNPAVYEFTVAGKPHLLVNIGEGDIWDGERAAADVERIVEEHYRMWGQLPYERYLFLNMITESGGAIEHKDSTLLMTSRWRMRDRDRYLGWLSTVSHEFFHAWNVKRLRPIELGPFDYEIEVHTRSLWIAEGLTAYYGPLAVRRAGLMTRDEYLDDLSGVIRSLQTTPGRLVQSVGASSYDAWIKYYRRNENSSNTTTSYYTKGAVIGFLLDARIRRATEGERSLDDVMRLAYDRYSGERGYTPEEFQATAAEVAGIDLTRWFRRALDTVDELDYLEAQGWFGLELSRPGETAAENENGPSAAWLGLTTGIEGGRLLVRQVRRETPGHAAGFNVGDEILAIGEYRVGADDLAQRLRVYRPGETVTVLIARRERLERLDVTFGEAPERGWQLKVSEAARRDQSGSLEEWLDPVHSP